MKLRFAAALAAGVAALTLAPVAAQAAPHHGDDSVRYASIKACKVKGGVEVPCGAWRLVMHSGMRTTLPGAQSVALEANGKSSKWAAAPVAVSGNGKRIAYFTTSGRLAVRTVGGGVQVFGKDALPRAAQYDVTLQLSDDGSRLAAEIGGDKPRGTRIFDTATGQRLGTVPAAQALMGFSADGEEVLTSADGDESVTDLSVYGDDGQEQLRATPPQLVSANGPQALSGDGRTVAAMVMSSKPQLVLYDLESDQVVARKHVTLPKGDLYMIDWTGPTQVTLHLARYSGSKPTRLTIVQIDTGSGAVKVRDRYSFLKDSFTFAACGG
ncbi:MAG: hypothetical protein HOY71_47005 [Nonomuraea sp.]|nr:hypothetical protein [Nonomuraea sp.]